MNTNETMEEMFDREFGQLTTAFGVDAKPRIKDFIRSELALREQEIVAGIRALTSVETKNTDIQGEALADIAADTKGEAWELGYEAAIKNVLATITKKD